MEKLTGLFAAPFTPLDDRGELALDQVDSLVGLYKKNGVKGAFVGGTTGEGESLSASEKKDLIKKWGKTKDEDCKVLFMLGGTSLKEMQDLAAYSHQCQLDGISILCPYYFKPSSVEQLVLFCKEISDVVPDMPFYYYHIPALSGGNFSMIKFLELAEEQVPGLAGIKYSHPNIMEFHACTRFKEGKYDILWGIDEALLSGLVIGAKGAVGSTYNYAAPLYNQILAAFEDGDLSQAEALQFKAVQMVELLVKYGGIGAGKAFMKLIGLDCGWFRQPIEPLTDSAVQDLKEDLDAIDFFTFCSNL